MEKAARNTKTNKKNIHYTCKRALATGGNRNFAKAYKKPKMFS